MRNNARVFKILYNSCKDGPGIRVSIFFSGCSLHCPGCFNVEAQDYKIGKKFTNFTLDEIGKALDHEWINGISILGGEPLDEANVTAVYELINYIRFCFGHDKTIWLWTGYNLKKKKKSKIDKKILKNVDVVIDGPFIQELRDPKLLFKGSKNQRVLHHTIFGLKELNDLELNFKC